MPTKSQVAKSSVTLAKKNSIRAAILLMAVGIVGGSIGMLVLYWYDMVEFFSIVITSVGIYLGMMFIFGLQYILKKRAFSGCTFLSKAAKEHLKILSRKITLWNICYFFDFAFSIYLIQDLDFRTVDLQKYIQGGNLASRINLNRP
jgi:uncharacterized membrane protein YfcA